jgi:hypothetical protein
MSDAQASSNASSHAASEDRAVASLNEARRAVETAATDVRKFSRRLGHEQSWQARSAAVFVDVLRTSVRAAPLTMMSLAFVAGAMLFSPRRRRAR